MLVSLRAAIAVALLVGFYVLALGLVGGLVVGELLLLQGSVIVGIKVGIIVVPIVYALVRGLFTIARAADDEADGVLVTPAEQPRLWERVNQIAAEVGTRPPHEIRIIPDVNAMVSERTRLLGLIVLRRRMYIGAPLLACLTEKQISAVLAHELGHYSNKDTRLSALVMTGRIALIRVIERMNSDDWFRQAVTRVFVAYAKLYFKVSMSICRRQELAADAVSARIAGSSAAASALREIPVIDAAWSLFVDRHLSVAWTAGYLPTTVSDGFARLRSAPELHAELDRIRDHPGDGDHGPYDSHPPTPERIAAIEAMAAEASMGWGDRPATDLLVGPEQVMDSSLLNNMADEAAVKKRVDWDELGHLGARGQLVLGTKPLLEAAGRLMAQPATLGTVLDALDAGRLAELAPADIRPGSGTSAPRVRREFARGFVLEDLSALLAVAFADAGRGRWERDWLGRHEFVSDAPDDLVDHLDAATEDRGSTAGLREALTTAGIALDYRPTV